MIVKPRKPIIPVPLEHDEQCRLFELAEMHFHKYPELQFLNGSINGVKLNIGQAVKAKRAGLVAGFPDVFLPVRKNPYGGLFIELKRRTGGHASPQQVLWAAFLESQGYQHHFCRGSDAAWTKIIEYLEGK